MGVGGGLACRGGGQLHGVQRTARIGLALCDLSAADEDRCAPFVHAALPPCAAAACYTSRGVRDLQLCGAGHRPTLQAPCGRRRGVALAWRRGQRTSAPMPLATSVAARAAAEWPWVEGGPLNALRDLRRTAERG